MCAGKPSSGFTKYAWDAPMQFALGADNAMKFDCAHCGAVNRWMAGDKPVSKCRQCVAPEKVK